MLSNYPPRFRALSSATFVALAASLLVSSPPANATGADGTWSLLSDPATAPTRNEHAAFYDPVRDRLLIFGGVDGVPTDGLSALSFSPLPAWTRLFPTGGGPSTYFSQQGIYDPVRDRMIVLDGNDNGDVWALPLSGPLEWSRFQFAGTTPASRRDASVIYDPVRDRMILFGGATYASEFLNDVWALSLGPSPAWTQLAPLDAPPSGRVQHTAAYDPVRDRMIVYGGASTYYGNGYLGDTWALSLSGTPAWSAIQRGQPLPGSRALAKITYDPARDRLILYGGVTTSYARLGDTWELPLGSALPWHEIGPANPPPGRSGCAAIYDPVRDRLVVHGGWAGEAADDATFALPLSGSPAWSRVLPTVPPPALVPRDGASVVYDSKRQRVIVYGGSTRPGDVDTWAFSPSDLTWTPIVPAGPSPPPRFEHSAIYDPDGDRMIIFGGYFSDDAWSLSFDPSPAWAPLPSGPSYRGRHAAVYDPVRRRMIVSGGYVQRYSDMDTSTAEVWALSLSGDPVWSQLPHHPSEGGIYYHSMIYDPVRDRVLTIGGSIKRQGTVIVRSLDHRVFSLPLGSNGDWSELSSTGDVALRGFSTVYDPGRDRLIMLGGYSKLYPGQWQWSNAIWARPADDAGVWAPLAPDGAPPSLEWRRGIFDEAHDRVVVVPTTTDPEVDDADQAWSLAFSGLLVVPRAAGLAFSLDRPWPVPARGDASVSFTLPDAAPARLELLDLAGRRIWSLDVGARGAGKHVVPLRGASGLSPGLYVVRLARGTRSLSAKLVVTR